MASRGVPQEVLETFPSVVRIYAVMEQPTGGRMERLRGAGSGAIISPDGYVVTNHHVAGNTTHLICNLADQQEVPARLVGTDALADIAVLKIDMSKLAEPASALPVARWGDSDQLRVGDTVFAMGSPAAISQSVTKGIVANDRMVMPDSQQGGMKLDGEDNGAIVRWIMHDATIFGGNSGGPLMNASGEIIGINEIGFANLSGAIPGNLARAVAQELIEHGRVQRSWIGIELQPRLERSLGAVSLGAQSSVAESPPAQRSAKGSLVADVAGGSPAARAGLQAGDRLLSLGGVVTDCRIPEELPNLNSRMMSLAAGVPLEARYVRRGKEHSCQIVALDRDLAKHPQREVRQLACTVSTLSRSERRRLGFSPRDVDTAPGDALTAGALVGGVRASGPAGKAHPPLVADDVIVAVGDHAVRDAESLLEALAASEANTVLLHVRRGGQQLLLCVELEERAERRPPARAVRAWLPIRTQVVSKELAVALGLNVSGGVRITEVLPEAPAGFALAVGDVLTRLGGKAVPARRSGSEKAFQRLCERCQIGEEVEVVRWRSGEVKQVAVAMMSPPPSPAGLATYREPLLEFTSRMRVVKARAADDAGVNSERPVGVDVVEVERGGWASLAGLQKGDRILRLHDQDIASFDQFLQVLQSAVAAKPERIVVLVERGQRTRFCAIEPVWP